MTITADKVTAKKLRIIEQIDRALIVLDREESGYEYIVDTMSVMQLQTIKGELFDEIWYLENRPQKITINVEIKRLTMKKI